jgi:hypothetical protein
MMNNILIGGNMLGRGITIPNLTVTYITRRAINETNADTMEQRARWFGYKQDYIDLCRVFLTRQLIDNYTELVRHEDDFWASLTRNSRQNGLSIRDWPRIMRLDTVQTGIQPTRQNVASYRPFHSRGWDTQTKVNVDATITSQNFAIVDNFFSERKDRLQEYKVGSTAHNIIENCPTEELVNELLVKINSIGTSWDNTYNCEYLMRLLLDGRLPTVDIVQIIKGGLRERGWVGKPNHVSIMQGPATNYPGDKEIHRNRPQLQVHKLLIKETGQMALALALYIPQDNRFDMQYIVRSEPE